MALRPGDLDRRITIMKLASEDDGLSSNPGEAQEVGKRWASRSDISDGERVRAGQNGQNMTTRFVVYWDEVTSTIGVGFTIVCEGRSYSVVGTKEVEGRRVAVEITTNALSGNV